MIPWSRTFKRRPPVARSPHLHQGVLWTTVLAGDFSADCSLHNRRSYGLLQRSWHSSHLASFRRSPAEQVEQQSRQFEPSYVVGLLMNLKPGVPANHPLFG